MTPYHVDRDDPVVLRLGGKRIEARLERVGEDPPEYTAARAARRSKFSSAAGTREAAEHDAAGSVVRLGGRLSDTPPKGRFYRAVPARRGRVLRPEPRTNDSMRSRASSPCLAGSGLITANDLRSDDADPTDEF